MAQLIETHGFPSGLTLDADVSGEFFRPGFDADPLLAVELAAYLLQFDFMCRLIRLPLGFVERVAFRVGHQEPTAKCVVEHDVAGRVGFDPDIGGGRFITLEPQSGSVPGLTFEARQWFFEDVRHVFIGGKTEVSLACQRLDQPVLGSSVNPLKMVILERRGIIGSRLETVK